MVEQYSSVAVLTGDLVGSRALGPELVETAFGRLSEGAGTVAVWQGAETRFTRSRGDGWQMLLIRADLALRAAAWLRALLIAETGADSRIAMATGSAQIDIGQDLNAASGEAFTASGQALDAMEETRRLAHADGGAIGAVTRLADHLVCRWTPTQAKAVVLALPPDPVTRAEAGRALGKSRQAVDQALSAAGFQPLSEALAMVEDRA